MSSVHKKILAHVQIYQPSKSNIIKLAECQQYRLLHFIGRQEGNGQEDDMPNIPLTTLKHALFQHPK